MLFTSSLETVAPDHSKLENSGTTVSDGTIIVNLGPSSFMPPGCLQLLKHVRFAKVRWLCSKMGFIYISFSSICRLFCENIHRPKRCAHFICIPVRRVFCWHLANVFGKVWIRSGVRCPKRERSRLGSRFSLSYFCFLESCFPFYSQVDCGEDSKESS